MAISLPSLAQGQPHWKVLFTNPSRSPFHSAFFFDEHSGFIGSFAEEGIWRTNDGGVSWLMAPLTPAPTAKPGARIIITDIRMDSRTHGWATLEAQLGCGLYETTDGGVSWHATSYIGEAVSLWQTSHAITITNRGDGGGGLANIGGAVSIDGGVTFRHTSILDSTVGMAFSDDLHGVISGFWDTTWSRTTDGGVTWFKMWGGYRKEAWGLYAAPGTSNFYAASENGWDWDNGIKLLSSAWHSVDYGATWTKLGNLPIETTGHIAGVGDQALYVQHCWRDLAAVGGFMRSTDQGRTWRDVGGPMTDEDTRFAVMGCRGEVVIGFDRVGNVWKTIDGGDGAFAQVSLATNSTLKVDSIDLCSPRDTTISIQNLGCDTIYITNATAPPMPPLTVLDPSGGPPQFPYRILPGESGTFRIRLSSLFAGVYQTRLIIELEREGVFSYDTVQINSATRFANPIIANLKSLAFDSTTLCDAQDSEIVLSNDSCFTVQIVSSLLKNGTNFALLSAVNNDSIPSGTKRVFKVRFQPRQPGVGRDTLVINLLVLGKPVKLSYPLSGTGTSDNPRFIMLLGYTRSPSTAIDFGTRTTCDPDTIVPFLITNPACYTYLNVQLRMFDSTKTTTPPNDILKWNIGDGLVHRVHNTDTIKGGILASAIRRGSYRGFIRVVHWLDGQKVDTTFVPFQVTFVQGSKTLAMDASTRDLDTLPFCSAKDISIPIDNIGCDTLFFDSLSISGAGFSIVNKPSVPFMLFDTTSNGSHGTVLVHFSPTQAGPSSGVLTIRSDADSAKLRTINFRAYATPTDTVRLGALAARVIVRPGDTSMVSIVPGKTFHGKNISQIDMILEYNGDVMEALGSAVPGPANVLASSGPESHTVGQTVQFPLQLVGPNIPLDSAVPLVSQAFHFVLSDTTLTNFKVVKLTFNRGDPVFAKCALGQAVDTGTIDLRFSCGDSLLYRMMRDGDNFRIENGIAPSMHTVRPNPVSSGPIAIPFRALRATDVELQLTNEAGQQLCAQRTSIKQSGETTFDLNAATLPSGVYHYVLRPTDGGLGLVSGEFVVMK